MKVAHVIFSFNAGGAELMLIDILNEQIKTSNISLIIINKSYSQDLLKKIDNRIDIHFINRPKKSRNPLYIFKLNRLLFKLRANVIHCHNDKAIGLLLNIFKKISMITVHDTNITSNYFKRYKMVFAISKSVQNDLANRYNITSVLNYNGINLESVQKKEKIEKKKSYKMVCVARLQHEKKGQHLLIQAVSKLSKKGVNNFTIDFIGEGDSRQHLIDLTKKYNLEGSVNFLGLKSREFIYNNLKHYNLLIQPSIYEGFGLTVAEAILSKVPVLVSANDGPLEIVQNGDFGYCFELRSVDDMASKIEYIIKTYASAEMNKKVEEGYIYCKDNFDITRTSSRYIDLYNDKIVQL